MEGCAVSWLLDNVKLVLQAVAVLGAFAVWGLLALGMWLLSPNVNRTSSDDEP